MMVDYHTHILPDIDDGSKTPEQSIEMLRKEAGQGVSDVVLSSHFYASQSNIQEFLRLRQSAFETLRAHWEPGLPRIHLGAEVQYFEGICVAEDIWDLRIQGTKLLLLEMPFCPWSDRVIQDVLTLNERSDIQILLAHIDRYINLQPGNIWKRLADQGILMQANTAFFQGFWTRRKAIKMVNEGIIHMLGTDCHSLNSRAPDWSCVPPKVLEHINQASYLSDAQPIIP